jgi:hypothetical protein
LWLQFGYRAVRLSCMIPVTMATTMTIGIMIVAGTMIDTALAV